MKFNVVISKITHQNEIPSYWTPDDYRNLLTLFDFTDSQDVAQNDLKEMLYMAITDFEPSEAASILLQYKLGNELTTGQIKAVSHEMLEDKIAEEYPEPELHYDLFNINQLLFKAFNGTFPNTEASVITIECNSKEKVEMTEEIMTKLFSACLSEKSIIHRLYSEQLKAKIPFKDAAKFIWMLTKKSDTVYELITSKYWVEKEDIVNWEYDVDIKFFEN